MEYRDYYAILGVKKEASADEIKHAYRRLAKQHHPDLQPEKQKAQAGEKFKAINEAYEVLSDSQKRAKYDQIGPDWESAQETRRSSGPAEASPEFRAAEGMSGFSDFFSELFGNAGRQGFGVEEAYSAGSAQGQDVEAELPLTLEDAFHGGDKKISIMVSGPCTACGGSGHRGRGFCPTCGGTGEIRQRKNITSHLPRYVRGDVKLRLRGQGSLGANGKEPGDLFLRVKLLPHSIYKVSGSDLETVVTVMPWVAALGGEALVPSLDGPTRIRIPPGTHSGRPFRISGKGLGKEGNLRGDLYAVVRIDIAQQMSDKMGSLYQQMKETGA